MTRQRFEQGYTYDEFRRRVQKHESLWNGVFEHLEIPEDARVRLENLPDRRHVLVLAEDWCGDAASLVPILARLAHDHAGQLDLRVLERDENLDIMDRYLSHGGRSIPVAIVYDQEMKELGWWGPRPAPAQAMFRDKIRAFRAGELEDRAADVYRPILKWYRQDRGRHTIDEILMVLERGGEPRT